MFYNINQSKEYRELPQSYTFADGSTTGNFRDMPDATHKAEGFYPLEEVKPVFDYRIETLEFCHYEEMATKVKKHYVKVARDIDVLKSKKLQSLERHKESMLGNSLFQHDDHVWLLTLQAANDATQLQTLVGLTAQFPTPFSWTDADGNEVAMDQVQFTQFSTALAAQKLQIIGAAKQHLAAINALTDPLQVVEYDFSSGWGNYVPPAEEI